MEILYATATCLSQVGNCATEMATQRKQIWGAGGSVRSELVRQSDR